MGNSTGAGPFQSRGLQVVACEIVNHATYPTGEKWVVESDGTLSIFDSDAEIATWAAGTWVRAERVPLTG